MRPLADVTVVVLIIHQTGAVTAAEDHVHLSCEMEICVQMRTVANMALHSVTGIVDVILGDAAVPSPAAIPQVVAAATMHVQAMLEVSRSLIKPLQCPDQLTQWYRAVLGIVAHKLAIAAARLGAAIVPGINIRVAAGRIIDSTLAARILPV